MPSIPTMGPSFRSLPCWLRRRRLNTSSPAAASGRGVSSSVGSRAAADDDGRGRLAATPSEIPPRGWKDILLRVYSNVSEHRIQALVAGMTYYSLLALFPALAALVAVGAVIGFMTWLWISAIVILLGAELDAEMEHQTARDTTTGSPKPMGARGARVADTVGAAQSG